MRGGKRVGAGRPAGARNRRTVEMQTAVEQSGITPLEFLINIMRDETADMRTRLEAARGAAPFVHPKLATTELSVKKQPMDREAMIARLKVLMANNAELVAEMGYLPKVEEQTS